MKLGDAVYELKECYQYGIGVEKKHTKRKAVWLMMILNANHYQQENCDVDISMDTELQLKKAQDYVKKWKRFNPETDEERKLKELIEIWGGIKQLNLKSLCLQYMKTKAFFFGKNVEIIRILSNYIIEKLYLPNAI